MKRLFWFPALVLMAGCSALPGSAWPSPTPQSSLAGAVSLPPAPPTSPPAPIASSPQIPDEATRSPDGTDCTPIAVPDLTHTGSAHPGGYPPDVRILAGGPPVSEEEIRATGFGLQLVPVPAPLQALIPRYRENRIQEVDQYYADKIDVDMSANDFIAAGGVLITQAVTAGVDAQQVVENVKGAAVVLNVGPFDAAVIWGSPLRPEGARPYRVYWSDGTFDWAVIAGTEKPEDAIAIAASLYCS
jgi:hypothetical protein